MNVAGPGALLVAKLHKLGERVANSDRVKDKDALDVFRILRAIETQDLADRLVALRNSPKCQTVTDTALVLNRDLFGASDGDGVLLACRDTSKNNSMLTRWRMTTRTTDFNESAHEKMVGTYRSRLRSRNQSGPGSETCRCRLEARAWLHMNSFKRCSISIHLTDEQAVSAQAYFRR
jgi:hypothetical protein